MATDHSTETTAKLLKAIHPETDTLWVLCVDLCVYVCLWSVLRCELLEGNRMFPSHTRSSSPYMSQLVSPLVKYTMG